MNVREWALPVYTILMQFAIGTLFVLWLVRTVTLKQLKPEMRDRILRKPLLVVVSAIGIAIVGSHFHLSRPYFSFLAILNFRYSWLSREVAFTVILMTCCIALVYLVWFKSERVTLITRLGWLAVACGGIVILCMSSLYLIPTQPIWNTSITVLLFFGSALVLGPAVATALLIMDSVFSEAKEPELSTIRYDTLRRTARGCIVFSAVGTAAIIALNGYQIGSMGSGDEIADASLRLLLGVYGPLLVIRLVSLVVGIGLLIMTMTWIFWKRTLLVQLVVPIHLACLLVVVAEILGRFLFYATHVRVGV